MLSTTSYGAISQTTRSLLLGKEERENVLTELIRARFPDGRPLTQDEIVGEVVQMLYAGHLTIPFSLINFWREIEANGMAEKMASEGG
jgi:cytochrome P450